MPLTFEDLEVGATERFGRYEVTREEVIDFASRFDPQPFHLDDAAAADSIFGRLAASGWHTAAMAMRMMVDHWKANGLSEISMGGAGMEQLSWPRPVYPGDVLTMEAELLEKRVSRSRPDMGIVKSRWTVLNQNGEVVMVTMSMGMFRANG